MSTQRELVRQAIAQCEGLKQKLIADEGMEAAFTLADLMATLARLDERTMDNGGVIPPFNTQVSQTPSPSGITQITCDTGSDIQVPTRVDLSIPADSATAREMQEYRFEDAPPSGTTSTGMRLPFAKE